MNVAAAVLMVGVAFTQTISFTNCCQGILCPEKDACPPCDNNAVGPSTLVENNGVSSAEDCCGQKSPLSSKSSQKPNCVHLEPSSDVECGSALANDGPAVIANEMLDHPVDFRRGVDAHSWITREARALIPPKLSPAPLYLAHQAILI